MQTQQKVTKNYEINSFLMTKESKIQKRHHWPSKCPRYEWHSAVASHASVNCSSSEMKTVGIRRDAFPNDDEDYLHQPDNMNNEGQISYHQ